MGMTIDTAERLLNNHLDGVTNYCELELTDKAIQVAIETMRKYQKIEQIVKAWNDNNSFDSMVQINGIITGWTNILDKHKVGKEEKETEFHCGFEESGGHAYNCNDCPNKCDEWYQWDKEMKAK